MKKLLTESLEIQTYEFIQRMKSFGVKIDENMSDDEWELTKNYVKKNLKK
jgi:hypothetical protein